MGEWLTSFLKEEIKKKGGPEDIIIRQIRVMDAMCTDMREMTNQFKLLVKEIRFLWDKSEPTPRDIQEQILKMFDKIRKDMSESVHSIIVPINRIDRILGNPISLKKKDKKNNKKREKT